MPGTDFFDDDLVRSSPPAQADEAPANTPRASRLERAQRDTAEQAEAARLELEAMRAKQQRLEQERLALEEMSRRQGEYIRGKRELVERLQTGLVALEKDEIRAQRTAELMKTVRGRFRELLEDVVSLRDENWSDENLRDELGQALAVLERAREEYNRELARVEAVRDETRPEGESGARPAVFDEWRAAPAEERSFGHWLKVGLAVSLPLILTLIVLAALVWALQMAAWF